MPKRAATKRVADALEEDHANEDAETTTSKKKLTGGKRKKVEPAAGLQAIQRKHPDSSESDFSYDPHFIAKDEQLRLIKELDKVPWVKVTYEKFKQQRSTPRHTFCYGTPVEGESVEVSYRGPHYMTEAMPEWLDTLKKKVEERTGFEYNAAIMNNYINSGEYISWHTDDERFLKHTTVASLSFGAARTFHVRTSPFGALCKMKGKKPAAAKPAKKKAKVDAEEEAPVEFSKDLVEETAVKLISGSLSVLYNGIEHSVPKETPEKFGDMTNRYNITFRCLKDFEPSQKMSGWGNYYNYNRGAAYQVNKK